MACSMAMAKVGRYCSGIGLALALSAAWSADSVPAATDPIKICSIDDRSGAAAETGNQSFEGLQLAVDEANAAGGVNGRKIQIISYDSKTDPQAAATFAARCADDDRGLVIIGGNPTAAAAAMIPVANESGLPYFMMSAAADDLTDRLPPFSFRFGPTNRQDASAIASLLAKNGFKRVAIVNGSLPSLTDGGRATALALAKLDIPVIVQQTYDVNATDLSPQLITVREMHPDVMVIYPYPADGARLLRTARQLSVNTPIIVARTALLESMRKLAGEASDGVLVPNTVDTRRADVKRFFGALNARFGVHQPTLYSVLGYDAGKAAIQVLAQPDVQANISAGKVREARIAFRDQVEKIGSFKSLQGLTGTNYQFGPNHHHGLPDDGAFIFTQVTQKGTLLVSPDLTKFTPGP